jgi:hypothetical protein
MRTTALPMYRERKRMSGNTLNADFVLLIVKQAPFETIRRFFNRKLEFRRN